MVADALVYHPAVAHYLRFVATTSTFPDGGETYSQDNKS